jgi:putative transposase
MSGVVLIEIRETESELKAVLREEKDATRHEKLQVVYWLKTKTVETVLSVAVRLGKHRTTIQRWLSSYREGRIEKLLFQKPRSGRPRIMNPETVERLSNQLPEKDLVATKKYING